MTDKQMKQMSRKELLEILIDQGKEIAELKKNLRAAEEKLNEKELIQKQTGTMSEAALKLNGVFESVDAAVTQYLENIKLCHDKQQAAYDQIIFEAETKAAQIVREAEEEKDRKMKEADDYWQLLTAKMEEFYQAHQGLKELLNARSEKRLK